MKAGIYQCYDGTLLYVAKDRTVKAFTSCVFQDGWSGEVLDAPISVTTSNREQRVSFGHNSRDVEAKRIDNVPNGCTDPLRALSKASHSTLFGPIVEHGRARDEGEHLVDYVYAVCAQPTVLDALIGRGEKRLLKTGCKMCGQSVCDECGSPMAWPDAVQPAESKKSTVSAESATKLVFGTGNANCLNLEEADRRFAVIPENSNAGEDPYVQFADSFRATGAVTGTTRTAGASPSFAVGYGKTEQSFNSRGFRLCHAASARKHRKRGDQVVSVDGKGLYAWKQEEKLTPYQQRGLNALRGQDTLTLDAPAGLGKTRKGGHEK